MARALRESCIFLSSFGGLPDDTVRFHRLCYGAVDMVSTVPYRGSVGWLVVVAGLGQWPHRAVLYRVRLAFGSAFKETLDVGQLSPILVLSLVIAYSSRSNFQDGAVGMGFALKYIPGVLAAALILHRGWRAFLAFAGMATLAVLIPWGLLLWVFMGARRLEARTIGWALPLCSAGQSRR